jgi:agmatine deiminase
VDKKAVYFSDLLPERFPKFFSELSCVLKTAGVTWRLLPHTKDIWCRDYMPVYRPAGVEKAFGVEDTWVQFKYAPSYLNKKKWFSVITNAADACRAVRVKPHDWPQLVVDGGNIVRRGYKAIMTEQVYKENPEYRRASVHSMVMNLLNLDELIIVPVEPGDPYGHADGCVRFIDRNTALINEPHKSHPVYAKKLRKVLQAHGLSCVEMPYFIDYDPKNKESAVGNYLNYLEKGDVIVAPAYSGYPDANRRAGDILKRIFGKSKRIFQVESTPVAKLGGVLNCISWNT